jgi:uncharacterized protein YjbI with pentapeptide repeats
MEPHSSFRELLDRYAQGERDFAEADLDSDPERDLAGVCLDGADLSRAFIVASFRGARLRGVRFHQANVKTCDFGGADLRGSDFREAALCSAEFEGAKLDGASFAEAYIHSHTFGEGEKPVG